MCACPGGGDCSEQGVNAEANMLFVTDAVVCISCKHTLSRTWEEMSLCQLYVSAEVGA